MLNARASGSKGTMAVETDIPQLNFFVTISNQSGHVREIFIIRNKESVFAMHPIHIGLYGSGDVSIKQALLGIDFHGWVVLLGVGGIHKCTVLSLWR